MIRPNRRDFFPTALALGAVALDQVPRLLAIEPIKRTGKPKLTLSLAAYSYNKYLNLHNKKPAMTIEDFIDIGGKLKLPAVELTAYYFPKTSKEYLEQLLSRCKKHNMVVSGTAVGNDFCWPDKEKLKAQLAMVNQWVEHSAVLGARTMRIFAGSVKKGDTEDEARKRCIDTIHKACDRAAKYKVYLALENHGGITSTAARMLEIVKAVKHDWFGVNLDTANFHTDDPYGDLEKIAPYAVTVQIKTEIHPRGKRQDADLKKLTDMLRKANYQGYVALEYEAAEDPRTAVPRHIANLKKYMD